MQTVILCGGKGTRLGPQGERDPKPLLPVGGKPILWHIMKIYATYGHTDFVLCTGHLAERFRAYAETLEEPWTVSPVDTGLDTPTGGRIRRVAAQVESDTFFATYGDGVADIDFDALLAFHRAHGRIATVTAVRPSVSFGLMRIGEGGRVEAFDEKPVLPDWVNGGFFVFGRDVFDYLDVDSVLEREPFEQLAAAGELMAFRHGGFWSCMDTYKDNLELNERWAAGQAPWKTWEEP
jgi:glucose-1-phosphate cytidylyltransferase